VDGVRVRVDVEWTRKTKVSFSCVHAGAARMLKQNKKIKIMRLRLCLLGWTEVASTLTWHGRIIYKKKLK
jgi:hypothetical protein